jgi:hypothetical protein
MASPSQSSSLSSATTSSSNVLATVMSSASRSVSPAVPCVATNLVPNGGFELNYDSWTFNSTGVRYSVASSPAPKTGEFSLITYSTIPTGQGRLRAGQGGYTITPGTAIYANMMVKMDPWSDCTFLVSFDDTLFETLKPSGPTKGEWQQVGTGLTPHVVEVSRQQIFIDVTCHVVLGSGPISGVLFQIEDVYIVPACSSPTSTAPPFTTTITTE